MWVYHIMRHHGIEIGLDRCIMVIKQNHNSGRWEKLKSLQKSKKFGKPVKKTVNFMKIFAENRKIQYSPHLNLPVF